MSNGNKRVVISNDLGLNLITKVHKLFGHLGKNKLMNCIGKRYYFKNIRNLIQQFKCETCLKNKSRRERKIGYSSILGPRKKPLEIVSLDTVGVLSIPNSTIRYLHVLIDHFTRFVWVLPSKSQETRDFVKLIGLVLGDNKIDQLLVDQYPALNSRKMRRFLKVHKIKLINTSVDNPSSNGINERVNQTLINIIRCKLNCDSSTRVGFRRLIEEAVVEYNMTEHSVTGYSPKFLLTGVQTKVSPFEDDLNLNDSRVKAFENTISYVMKNKSSLDANRKDRSIEIGDLVYVESENKLNRSKMDELRNGPVKVLDKLSPLIYK